MEEIRIPSGAARILKILEEAGHEAFVVGGCVRDALMGRIPKDWDITTSAKPQEIKALFQRTIDTGLKHGTITVRMDGASYEVTTYRIDGDYADHRHPDQVTFTTRLEDDLLRRDLTVNAMAYNERRGIVDPFGGQDDLKAGIVRAVGDAMKRFDEDALRMMRAVRFCAQLDFTMEDATKEAVRTLAPTLSKVSAERIRDELEKILISDHPEYVRKLYALGLTKVFFPELSAMMDTAQNNPHHCYNVGEHTLHALEASVNDRLVRVTILLHDVAKPLTKTTDAGGIDHFKGHPSRGAELAETILRRWKEDTQTVTRVKNLIKWHDLRPESDPVSVRTMAARVGRTEVSALLDVMEADVKGQSSYLQKEKLTRLEEIRREWARIEEAEEPLAIADLAVNGQDLMDAGLPAGPALGEKLHEMLCEVLREPAHNDKEWLLKRFVGNRGKRQDGE